jgi:adenosine kinase
MRWHGQAPGVGIVAPDSREGMLHHAQQFAAEGIPFIFDLGQAMPLFNGEDLRQFVELASYVTVNDYEAQVLLSRTAWTSAEVAAKVRAFIVTHGERGASVFADGKQYAIPAVQAERVVDPPDAAMRSAVACSTASRTDGLGNHWPPASLMGALKIAQQGPQNHWISCDEIGNRFQSVFGYRYA